MKRILLIILTLSMCVGMMAEAITDEVWLKAVALNKLSQDLIPGFSVNETTIKDKKDKVISTDYVKISHKQFENGVYNEFVEGHNAQGDLNADSPSVAEYLKADYGSTDDDSKGIFRTETDDSFTWIPLEDETIDNVTYRVYEITVENDEDGKKIDTEGSIWLNSETGMPLKSELSLDVHKMMIKSMNVVVDYAQTEDGKFYESNTTTSMVISVLFKKMFVTHKMTIDDMWSLKR